ncbi:MAG: ROK family protein [Spirochaetales bacterium]
MTSEPVFVGVDIGGTKTAVVAGGPQGGARWRVELPTVGPTGPREPRELLDAVLAEVRRREPVVTATGVSCGGPLDEAAGVVLCPPNLPAWREVPVTRWLTEGLGAPAFLENDANACAVAEWREGAGKGASSVVFLTFGTGLGAGIVLGGRLWRGANGMAGELGHWRLSEDGPVGYGKAGSFEGWCSGGGLAQQIASHRVELTQRGELGTGRSPTSPWSTLTDVKGLGAAAEAGDPGARALLERTGVRLGRGLALLVDLLNPEVVVLGSIFVRLERWLRPSLEAELGREALGRSVSACRVVAAGLGEELGDRAALWAARLGWETQGGQR